MEGSYWWLLAYFAGGFVYSELSGYWLHKFLHSEKIAFLSRNHMIHHLRVYGPEMKQRPSTEYRPSTQGRATFSGYGMEWVLPITVILALIYGTFFVLGLGMVPATALALGALTWGVFLFGYMHDNMHKRDFWMADHRLLGPWFRKARRKHDIHHVDLAADGRMDKNFGICFFGFDRLFGTFHERGSSVKPEAIAAARAKYAHVIGE